MNRLAGLLREDREDKAVALYSENVGKVGNFPYVSAAVGHPEADRKYFNLLRQGISRASKSSSKAEKSAMSVMETARATAQSLKRERTTGQMEVAMPGRRGSVGECTRCFASVTSEVQGRSPEFLRSPQSLIRRRLELTLSFPLVWESDLKDWVRDWPRRARHRGRARGNMPRLNANNFLVWQETRL